MNIPTAEQWVNQQFEKQRITTNGNDDVYCSRQGIIEACQIFAKLHVEAALKEASEKGKIQEDFYNEDNFSLNELKELADEGYPRKDNYGEIYAVDIVSIDKDSILNAYPLTNIK